MTRFIVPGYTLESKVGSGSYADVYKASKNTGVRDPVAIKCISKKNLSTALADSIVTEIQLLKRMKHPHIVEMLDFFWDESFIYVVMEFCNGGDLSSFIRSRKSLSESVCQLFLRQLASALSYLRLNNVSHMDLKPQNLLLTSKSNPRLKLADFGLAQSLRSHEKVSSLKGSPLYMAPEILLENSYDASVDLWSVGVILYECLFGRAPYSSKTLADLIDKIKKETEIKIPVNSKLSPEARDLLVRLLQRNPKQRITFEYFFNHPFIVGSPLKGETEVQIKSLIQRAQNCESKNETSGAFQLYCDALKILVPIVQSDHVFSRKSWLQEQLNFCFQRAEYLKQLGNSTTTSREPNTPNSSQSLSSPDPAPAASVAPFNELRMLVNTTPSLKSAIDIGIVAVQYDAEGQLNIALERYEAALQQILGQLSAEPKGRRKELLHQQASIWLNRAEKLKEHIQRESDLEASYEDLKQCCIQ